MIVGSLRLALGVSSALVSFALGVDSTSARELPTNGNIAYVLTPGPDPSRPDTQSEELRIMSPDGSKDSQLTAVITPGSPDWSPDGSRMAFDVRTDFRDPGQIYTINADGSGLTNLTGDSPLVKGPPAWSPDGSRIAFIGLIDGRSGLYMMDADGNNFALVTEVDADVSSLSWSPDGARIAYSSTLDKHDFQIANTEIYIMNADGSAQRRLTDSPGMDIDPDWSPDGSKIVFVSKRETESGALYVMNADGSDQRPLIPNHRCTPPSPPPASPPVCLGDEQPTWSPDGTMIAFVGFAQEDPGFSDIFVVRVDGTDERRLTHTPDFEWSPSWQPIPAGETPAQIATIPPMSSPVPRSPAPAEPCMRPSPTVAGNPASPTLPGASPSFTATPTVTASPVGTPPPTSPSESAFPEGAPSATPTSTLAGGPDKDGLPTPTPRKPATATTVPQASEPMPSPSTTPLECEQRESSAEITAQAAGLIALGVLAAGSVVALSVNAVRRRRS